MRKDSRTTVAIALGVVLAGTSSATAFAAPAAPLGAQDVEGVIVWNAPLLEDEAALIEFIAATPTAVTLDVDTGQMVTVTGNPVSTGASTRNVCQAGDSFWAAVSAPYTNNCFYGSSGTVRVSGTPTKAIYTGNYTARGTYPYGGNARATPIQAPGSVTHLTSVVQSWSGTIY